MPAGISVLEQEFELAEQDLFAQLDKLLVEKGDLTLSCGAYPVCVVCPSEVTPSLKFRVMKSQSRVPGSVT
ncbi:hypothetical protein MRX96_019618 [Rhipicephalus microplus]